MKRVASALILFAMGVLLNTAIAQEFNRWTVSPIAENASAAVQNDSGNLFGQFCYQSSNTCYFKVGLKTPCDDGVTSPAIANADGGATALSIRCDGALPGSPGYYAYYLYPFDTVDTAIRSSKRVGIAFPLQNDQIAVIRFSLEGATAAIDRMRLQFTEARNKRKSSTRDQVL